MFDNVAQRAYALPARTIRDIIAEQRPHARRSHEHGVR